MYIGIIRRIFLKERYMFYVRFWGGRECGVLGIEEKLVCLECGGRSRVRMSLEGEKEVRL